MRFLKDKILMNSRLRKTPYVNYIYVRLIAYNLCDVVSVTTFWKTILTPLISKIDFHHI